MYQVEVYLRVRKMTAYSVPAGYRRQNPPKRPKLEPFTGVINRILESDLSVPRKQRHTAKQIFERLRDEYGFGGQYTIVKDYVREHRRQAREIFVPLSHSPGHAQCDFVEARVIIGGVERKAHCFHLDVIQDKAPVDEIYEQPTRRRGLLMSDYASMFQKALQVPPGGDLRRLGHWLGGGPDRGPRV